MPGFLNVICSNMFAVVMNVNSVDKAKEDLDLLLGNATETRISKLYPIFGERANETVLSLY